MDGLLEILGKIGFDWQIALANLINFLIIFFLLNKLVFKPLNRVMKERQSKIEKGMHAYEESKAILKEAEEKKQEEIREAERASHDILAAAQMRARTIVEDAQVRGKQEFERILTEAQHAVELERVQAERSFRQHAVDLVADGVGTFIRTEVSDADRQKITKMLAQ